MLVNIWMRCGFVIYENKEEIHSLYRSPNIRGWSEKFPTKPNIAVKLGTSDRWVGTRTGAGVISTLV